MQWPAAAITEHVATLLPGFCMEVLAQIDSSNSELMRRARAGNLAPTLLVAQQQTQGGSGAAGSARRTAVQPAG
jgi:BirA family transcriptional regulator, biotin operon repressor / biotin---[acetyl-CoA-carboxylase] ligase